MIHLSGKYNLPLCNPGASRVQVSLDKSKVTCRLCWKKILRNPLASGETQKKKKLGQRQQPTPKAPPAKIIMRDGVPLMPKALRKVLPKVLAASEQIESRLSPKRRKGSPVGSLSPLGSGSVPTYSSHPPQEPDNGERIG